MSPSYGISSVISASSTKSDFRVDPMFRYSGLNAIELGSIPFLNDWLREAVRSSLSNFVAPRYANIDVAELLNRQVCLQCCKTYSWLSLCLICLLNVLSRFREKPDATILVPTISNLRRKTRSPVSTPRTSTPRGIAITSVADQLESRHSSLQAVGSLVAPSAEEPSIVQILKPITELSRLALDRHALKKENLVRPLTELSRMGMDRWLNSTIMTKRRREEAKTLSSSEMEIELGLNDDKLGTALSLPG